MDVLKINLKNCYGIQSLEYEFDFSHNNGRRPKSRAYAIYAPNGLMKTSLAKTFEDISQGKSPKEERYNRSTTCEIEMDGNAVEAENIYVLRSAIELDKERPAITNILVNPEHKARYDEILVDLEEKKAKLINSLQRLSKVKKAEIESTLLTDWGSKDFASCVKSAKDAPNADEYKRFEYATIFDPKALEVLKSPEFLSNADDFNQRYQELFEKSGTIYKKGIFNPTKAETSFTTLDRQGFFKGGHRVHLSGDAGSLDKEALNAKLEQIHKEIESDRVLKEIQKKLSKNAQTQALIDLFESLSSEETELFLEMAKPQNHAQSRKSLWASYLQETPDAEAFLEAYEESKDEIERIEQTAAQSAPQWTKAIGLFNDRFIDMPFKLAVENQAAVTLGKEQAKLQFVFEDGQDRVSLKRSEVRTLSQGESRALYLLYFIFDVAERILKGQETIFIIDDAADSFDYKNKHAILQYLRDLTNHSIFAQILLTHNFDFFRAVQNSFVPYNRCLMANKGANQIELVPAEGVKNIFINKWKPLIPDDERVLCASIPFVRNLIEYTRGEGDHDYLKLTSFLHWKRDSDTLTVGDFLSVYNGLFGTTHVSARNGDVMKNVIFENADLIRDQQSQPGLCLEDKVLMSIAIRLKSEIHLVEKLRILKGDPSFWCEEHKQFSRLLNDLQLHDPNAPELKTLEKVSVTVSSNIHLNSFMYEPILDLTVDHLINLYNEVSALTV